MFHKIMLFLLRTYLRRENLMHNQVDRYKLIRWSFSKADASEWEELLDKLSRMKLILSTAETQFACAKLGFCRVKCIFLVRNTKTCKITKHPYHMTYIYIAHSYKIEIYKL